MFINSFATKASKHNNCVKCLFKKMWTHKNGWHKCIDIKTVKGSGCQFYAEPFDKQLQRALKKDTLIEVGMRVKKEPKFFWSKTVRGNM